VMGDPGQRDCPAGSVPVPDAEACAAAAESLGKQLLEEGYAAESDPPGCQFRVPDQDIYFNSHDTGAPNPARQRVCKQDGSAPPAPAPAKPAAKSDATLLGAGNERSTRRVGSAPGGKKHRYRQPGILTSRCWVPLVANQSGQTPSP
ncbi:unnamed protein product, partial [Effrenium voratum]